MDAGGLGVRPRGMDAPGLEAGRSQGRQRRREVRPKPTRPGGAAAGRPAAAGGPPADRPGIRVLPPGGRAGGAPLRRSAVEKAAGQDAQALFERHVEAHPHTTTHTAGMIGVTSRGRSASGFWCPALPAVRAQLELRLSFFGSPKSSIR